MCEIRVICEPAEAESVTTVLNGAFATGTVRQYPTRDGKRHRLYVTADLRPEPGPWPTPEQAYANAPSIVQEIGWTARTVADTECFTELDREYYLRKAALLDRIALLDERHDADEAAEGAALALLGIDKSDGQYHGRGYWPEHPAAEANPRGYVRQEYADWANTH